MRIVRWLCLVIGLAGIGGASYWGHEWRDALADKPFYTCGLTANRADIETLAWYLRFYKAAKGEYPSNDQGLMAAYEYGQSIRLKLWRTPEKDPIGKHARIYGKRVMDAGILTYWDEPFVYENRRGMDPRKFAGSLARPRMSRHVGLAVDKDIYVWSIAAADQWSGFSESVHERNVKVRTCARRMAIPGAIGLLGLVMYIVATVIKVRGRVLRRMISLIGIPLIGVVIVMLIARASRSLPYPQGMTTCYIPAPPGPGYRSPEQKQYTALMGKYHERGVISDASYEKLRKAMEKDQ